MRQDNLNERVAALSKRRSKSPSHVEELRSAVLRELEDWREGLIFSPVNLLVAVERYDEAKGTNK